MFTRSRIVSLIEASGAMLVAARFCEAVQAKEIDPKQVSIRTLAEGFLGEDVVREWSQSRGGFVQLQEAGDPVNMRAFQNTIGGLIMAAMDSGYRKPAFIGDQLVEIVPTTDRNDRIGFPGAMEGTDSSVQEAEELPTAGFSDQYIDTPATDKRGAIVGVSREMVLADKTNRVVEQAQYVGEYVGTQREKKILRGVLGIDNPFVWNGTSYNTYLTTGAWVNSISNELVDHTNIEAVEIALANQTDPVSGDPILCMPDTIVVPTAKFQTAQRLVATAEIEVRTNSQTNVVKGPNPYSRYAGRVFTSPLIYSLLVASGVSTTNAAKYSFIGESRKAFKYFENWPLSVIALGPNHTREIELQFKASERGVLVVREPRAVIRSTN
ncbi:MAG: hypothetical protein JSS51_04455 [Planctomycetes bacterium]|nr:hypothetical protein [Planctomycetota bacterium]